MKIVRPIKVCLNEGYSKVCVNKKSVDILRVQDALMRGDALPPHIFKFA
jgi:hypothetical protein